MLHAFVQLALLAGLVALCYAVPAPYAIAFTVVWVWLELTAVALAALMRTINEMHAKLTATTEQTAAVNKLRAFTLREQLRAMQTKPNCWCTLPHSVVHSERCKSLRTVFNLEEV